MFFTVTSGKNLKFPNSVLCLVDAAGRRIPLGTCVLWFLVFTLPVFGPFLADVFSTTFGLGPNFCWSKIDQFEPRMLFAASYTLMAGHLIKLALC